MDIPSTEMNAMKIVVQTEMGILVSSFRTSLRDVRIPASIGPHVSATVLMSFDQRMVVGELYDFAYNA